MLAIRVEERLRKGHLRKPSCSLVSISQVITLFAIDMLAVEEQSDRENTDNQDIQRQRRTTVGKRSIERQNLLVKGRTVSCCSSQNMGCLTVELQKRCKSISETGDGIETQLRCGPGEAFHRPRTAPKIGVNAVKTAASSVNNSQRIIVDIDTKIQVISTRNR